MGITMGNSGSTESRILGVAKEAARAAGDVLLTHMSRVQHYELQHKDQFDFATEVDHAAEKTIIEFVKHHFPGHSILAEEGGDRYGTDSEYQWIIDPLDGTTNYLHGVRAFAVSIAVLSGNSLQAAVVFDPTRDEMYTAERGRGAYLNGGRIHVSHHRELHECLFATGFPFRQKEDIEPYLESFKTFFGSVRDIRRMGAAALDLAYIAAGRFDGFWELGLEKWDIAAGILLIQEAGGTVSGFSGWDNYFENGNIVASNGFVHDKMLSVLGTVFPEKEE